MGEEKKLKQNISSKTMEPSYSVLEPMEICKQIVLKFGIAVEKIINKNYHSFDVVKVRNVFIYLCRMYTPLSYGQIGSLIGCKDYAIMIREQKR